MDVKRFGKKLKEKRKQNGFTYQQLADTCHVNHGYIRQLESGLKMPSMQLMLSLCDILQTSPNYLLEFTEDNDDKEILERIYKLSPKQKQLLIYMLDSLINYMDIVDGEI